MKVLVTGGSGFIGSHVVDRLLAHGHEPRIYDLVESPYHRPDEVEQVIGDLVDEDALRPRCPAATPSSTSPPSPTSTRCSTIPGLAESVNGGGTRTLLEAARREGVSRVVYASTVWVYGDANGHGPLDEDEPLSLPGHLYTATKLAGEMYCSSYGALYGMDTTIARFGIPYGPRARPATVLAAFVARALADEPITIAGDGTQSRRFIYVEDLAEGVVATLDPAAVGRVYNLVGSESTTVREIADTVVRVVCPVPIVHVEGRAGDIKGAEISGARAKRELGWEATTTLRRGRVPLRRVGHAHQRSDERPPGREGGLQRQRERQPQLQRGRGTGTAQPEPGLRREVDEGHPDRQSRVEHRREGRDRATPGVAGAVVIGVVEQDDVAGARAPLAARRAMASGEARAPQSRPQRDHSVGSHPRRRHRASPAALNTP